MRRLPKISCLSAKPYNPSNDFGVTTQVQHDALPCAFMFNSTGPLTQWYLFLSKLPWVLPTKHFFHRVTNQRVRLFFH
ncbi:hypothetical protein J6590_084123 [Homalodisca vitripennis]|nr:hypothetical protein J6590_084123 [Homalodisca vitripennis]